MFSPAHAPLADVLALDDGAVREALLALTTRPATRGGRGRGGRGRERIAYGDLGVEQLGGVYERLLDFALPEDLAGAPRASDRRKATGSFYTPRSLTEALVRRTLAPLVLDASPDAILALRVVDPAMGSGAFLVAACRYLASAYELALIREGTASAGDLSDADRAGFRRVIAQRCLYGVDRNPMAVQLGRLSMWLATLAADRPLTFLDHRLRTGDSLVGAAPWDILRQQAPGSRSRARANPLPLFEDDGLDRALGAAVAVRGELALGPGDTLEQVRAKERALAHLQQDESGLTRWRRVADAWCAVWFQEATERAQSRTSFPDVMASIFQRPTALPARLLQRVISAGEAAAAAHRFFHWPLEFPELFHDEQGRALDSPGFDAVLGNPPWEMLRGDYGTARTRAEARLAGSRVADFVRGSGIYRLQGDGHVNLYQLFVERALGLLRRERSAGSRPAVRLRRRSRLRLAAPRAVRTHAGGHAARLREPRGPVPDSSRPQVPAGHRDRRSANDDRPGPIRAAPRRDARRAGGYRGRCAVRSAAALAAGKDERGAAGGARDSLAGSTWRSCRRLPSVRRRWAIRTAGT